MKNILNRLVSRKPDRKAQTRDAAIESAYERQLDQVRGLLAICLEELDTPVPAAAS